MFNTLKSKIIIIVFSMFITLVCVLTAFTCLYYRDTKYLMLEYVSKNVETQAQNINKELVKIEKNARSLALMGELYYKFDRNKSIAEKTVIQVFDNYPDSLGGGIWFKPYYITPEKEYDCIYVYRNKQGNIVTDYNFESQEYDYPQQSWYKEIMPHITKNHNIEWSSPYLEKIGSNSYMITAGVGIYDNNAKLVGISTVDWEIHAVVNAIQKIKNKLNLSNNCFALFAYPQKDYVIVSTDKFLDNDSIIGKSLKNVPWYNDNLINIIYFDYHGKKYTPYVKNLDNGMVFILCIPMWELFGKIFISTIILSIILLLLSVFLALMLYRVLSNNILKPIGKLIFIANKIGQGDNNIEIKIEKPKEFEKLASTFDKMTKDIKNITKERERIDSELAIAKSIQTSSLPDIFPPFPERKEFDIYASMIAAKEVGGDFYDFYFIDEDNFMFLIADVSGKGIPAALFMMTAKTLISNTSQMTKDPNELIELINQKICSNNKHGLFITMFAAIVNLKTGKMYCMNCGHNPPLIKQNDEEYKYLDIDANCVLGVIEDAQFKIYETQLHEGDIIFTYTDGVTEALNNQEEMYGEDRLLQCMNDCENDEIKEILNNVKDNVHKFTGAIPQSDDLTMLIFKYGSNELENKKAFASFATPINYKKFYTWLHEICNEWDLSEELTTKLDMCAEEIYANVQFYAYGEEKGMIEVSVTRKYGGIDVEFSDSGVKYNPLEKEDPDITLPPEERPVGGLGIFMVKQMADDVKYEYKDGKNILTISLS